MQVFAAAALFGESGMTLAPPSRLALYRWCCLETKTGFEPRVEEAVAENGYAAYLPLHEEGGPLFPHYLFARLGRFQPWSPLAKLPGVLRFLGRDRWGVPVTVPDNEINRLRRMEVNGKVVPPRPPKRRWHPGMTLRMRDPDHYLRGKLLIFAGDDANERVRVLCNWFGREQEIPIKRNLLEAVAAPTA